MNITIQPYRKESILIKDATKCSHSKNDSLYLVQGSLPDERLQNGLMIKRNDVYFDLRAFDLSLQIIEQSNLRNGSFENIRDIVIKKYKQTQDAYKFYGNRTMFSVTI